jgi:tRNA-dihydrouridine synthase 4
MSARGILANPALFAGHSSCPWEAVELFLNYAIRCPLPFAAIIHHMMEMCAPGMGADKSALLTKQERATMYASADMLELLDFIDDLFERKMGRPLRRDLSL